jgi:8-oxo-dGTP pyrophosphatase MutT (NUDIX family)
MKQEIIHIADQTITRETLKDLYKKHVDIENYFVKSEEEPSKRVYCDSLILNSEGELLILQRSYQDDFCPGTWSLPGGKMEIGDESTITGAQRELEEETGIKTILDFHSTLEKEDCTIHYHTGLVDNPIILLDNDEHYNFDWMDPSDEDEYDRYEFLKDLKSTLINIFTPVDGGPKTPNPFYQYDDITSLQKSFESGRITEEELFSLIKSKPLPMSLPLPEPEEDEDKEDEKKKVEDLIREGKSKGYDKKTLKKHAKSAPEESLLKTIKHSPDPRLRKHAHDEMERRKRLEYPEEKKTKKSFVDDIEILTEQKILDLIKSEGTYVDNWVNRHEGIVGQVYHHTHHTDEEKESIYRQAETYINITSNMDSGPYYEGQLNDQQFTTLDTLCQFFGLTLQDYRYDIKSSVPDGHSVEVTNSETGKHIVSTFISLDGKVAGDLFKS